MSRRFQCGPTLTVRYPPTNGDAYDDEDDDDNDDDYDDYAYDDEDDDDDYDDDAYDDEDDDAYDDEEDDDDDDYNDNFHGGGATVYINHLLGLLQFTNLQTLPSHSGGCAIPTC
ncbi:hypothetical protein PoB_006401400 [Plakobranchus ocellatus]|uniref:Uncharacterized protein n=1 Tax=Plakobranchus ocellatus TaxID=259542 RepID=A0AAV4CZY2_9GAST|nr:hypothetical protein PoB_006401400 [Plakobranchus ocellatus]